MKQSSISERTLVELFGDSLSSALCVNVEKGTEMWVATGMLIQSLESFTDGVVVRKDDKPLGVIGGKDVIEQLRQNPTSYLFDKTKVEDIMEKRIPTVSNETTLKELMDYWHKTRRAFALIPNEFMDYSAISAKKLLELGMRCKTDISISNMPEKKLETFNKDQTIGQIIDSMLTVGVRRLFLSDSSKFINDRMVLETITEDMKYLRGVENFLECPVSDFKLIDAKILSKDLSIPELSKTLYEMKHPCVIFHDKVVTPWDICLILLSENITEFDN